MLIKLSTKQLNLIKQIETLEDLTNNPESLFCQNKYITQIKEKEYKYLEAELCHSIYSSLADIFKAAIQYGVHNGNFSLVKYKFDGICLLVLLCYDSLEQLEQWLVSLKTQLEQEVRNV